MVVKVRVNTWIDKFYPTAEKSSLTWEREVKVLVGPDGSN